MHTLVLRKRRGMHGKMLCNWCCTKRRGIQLNEGGETKESDGYDFTVQSALTPVLAEPVLAVVP